MNSRDATTRANSPSRREFFEQSGRLAAASALTGVAIPRCHGAGDDTIRLALVGCGGRGTGAIADAFAASAGPVQLHAMADLFEPRLRTSRDILARNHGERVDVPGDRQFLGFDAYQKAIDCLRPGDVVVLATHAAFRPLHFEYAVQRGVHVFMEKSFAVDGPAVRRLLQAAERSEQQQLEGRCWIHVATLPGSAGSDPTNSRWSDR